METASLALGASPAEHAQHVQAAGRQPLPLGQVLGRLQQAPSGPLRGTPLITPSGLPLHLPPGLQTCMPFLSSMPLSSHPSSFSAQRSSSGLSFPTPPKPVTLSQAGPQATLAGLYRSSGSKEGLTGPPAAPMSSQSIPEPAVQRAAAAAGPAGHPAMQGRPREEPGAPRWAVQHAAGQQQSAHGADVSLQHGASVVPGQQAPAKHPASQGTDAVPASRLEIFAAAAAASRMASHSSCISLCMTGSVEFSSQLTALCSSPAF